MEHIIVSACLAGVKCRYDGRSAWRGKLMAQFSHHQLILLCPEVLGELPIPREESFFQRGDGEAVIKGRAGLISTAGEDRTDKFILGAKRALKLAKLLRVKTAYLKEKSPSCGVNKVYIEGRLTQGKGVTAYLLQSNGIEIIGVD